MVAVTRGFTTENDDVTEEGATPLYDVTNDTNDVSNSSSFVDSLSDDLVSTVMMDNQTVATNDSYILNTLKDILTTEETGKPYDDGVSQVTSFPVETTASPTDEGLSPMEKWFLVTACLIAACVVLMIINALLHYKETFMNELRKRDIGNHKRVRRDGMAGESDDRKEYQTHVFYHPFTNDGRKDVFANHL